MTDQQPRPPAAPAGNDEAGMVAMWAAGAAARRCRAEWMLGVTQGLIEPTQLVQHAATDDGAPLLRINLRRLLLARPGRGARDADSVIEALLREHPSRTNGTKPADLTVAWLLDNRALGRRFSTWLAVLHANRTEPPWPGFPFTPAPAGAGPRAEPG
jgi:hypothetical protein